MIRKFPGIPAFRFFGSAVLTMILTGVATIHAQQTTQQPPSNDQTQSQPSGSKDSSSSQEASPEETMPGRRTKAPNYKKWVFNVGGGANLPSGSTNKFVRGGGGVAAAGVARNYSKYFGLRLDFQFDNLPLRDSALQAAQAPSGTSQVYSLNLDPIINIPVTSKWGGYAVFGAGFYHRSGKLDSSSAIPGSACSSFYTWWGSCFNASLPVNGHFLSTSQNEFGYNFGGGITRKIRPNIDFYAEFRWLHGSGGAQSTDLRPITIGVRW
jgi:opacity protein-like surface antigen